MLKNAIKYFIYGNVWVALNVLFLTWTTYMSLGETLDYSLLSFAFFSTLLAYNFQRIFKFESIANNNSIRNQWLLNHKSTLYLLSTIGFLGTGISLFFLPYKIWFLLLIPSFFSIFYVVPVNRKKQSFRDLPYLKIYLIAFSWAFVAALIPTLLHETSWKLIVGLFFEKSLFVIALTIPFDIRDLDYDHPRKKTIPQVLGTQKSIYLACVALFASIGISSWLFFQGYYSIPVLSALVFSYLIALIVILQTKSNRHEMFYTGIIDGLFFVQFLLVFLAK